jgi:NADP-dependent aldehyde dehydrogenase
MSLHGKNFIGDQLCRGSGDTFTALSPLDNRVLPGSFHPASPQDVDQAVVLAEKAFQTYGKTSGEQRAAFLERIAEEIVALGEELIARAYAETGLPKARLTGERARTVGQLKMFAQVAREGSWVDARIDHAIPDRTPVPKPDLRRMLIPLGPVIVFGSSNFPLAFSVAGGDTASALATGNTVVVKAHSAHPGTSELVATAIKRAAHEHNLPAGVFSMVHGAGKIVGTQLVRHPLARAVGFTGSRTAGRALFDAAADRPEPIPVFAEMSSLNPVFILPQALRERGTAIAEGLRASMTLGVGQFCTKPGLVFGLQSSHLEEFQKSLTLSLQKVPPATMLHAEICESYHQGLQQAAQVQGVQELARSSALPDPTRTQAESVVLRTDCANFRQHPELAQEVFGPFALLITANTLGDLEDVARESEGQLTATVHGTPEDFKAARSLLELLERKAGRLILNGFPTGVEVCPSMNHGGPYPATTDVRFTSVGTAALYRFVRPVCYQDFSDPLLPPELQESNPLKLQRMVDGKVVE